jgi:hypothetical protein
MVFHIDSGLFKGDPSYMTTVAPVARADTKYWNIIHPLSVSKTQTCTNPILSHFEFPSASSIPNETLTGVEVDHDQDQGGDGEQKEGVQKSGRAGNRRRQKVEIGNKRRGCRNLVELEIDDDKSWTAYGVV